MQLNLTNKSGISTQKPMLKPWAIHDVILKSVEYSEFAKKDDPSQQFKTMKIRFENETGYFEETIFCPKDGDDVRKKSVNKSTGVETEMVSSFENFQIEIAHIGESLFSDNYAKFKTKSFNLPDQFKEFVELFKKAATPAINKSTKLKLIGNKEGRPRLPYFARINKEGDAVITNNFLGDKVFFSDYELTQAEKFKDIKPTNMKKSSTPTDDVESSESTDLDFEL